MLKIPENQVAGHFARNGKLGPLVDGSGRFYKPLQGGDRGCSEVSFYTSFSLDGRIPDHIRRFFPTFYGTELVEASDGSGLKSHLVLEDFTAGRVNPSIMDVKIGSRTWPPQAPEKYIAKCVEKDHGSSSLLLGFRFSGLQFHSINETGFWKPGKKSIQGFSADEVQLVLRNFVSSNTSKELELKPDCAFASVVFGGPTGILSQLLELKAWFEDQTVYHFFSSSIHIMYEKQLALQGKNPRAEIKLIDFAHVVEGRGVIDHNYLGGLCSLIKFVSEILKVTNKECQTNVLPKDAQRDHDMSVNGTYC
ncbi:OLC1v1004244C1 [Oldenlandia corymbosa var. corymbosa]|uniref:Inositol polyphosphate multikinase n=1 Tax=Oldenlandia corymbosa var. corymbosa TaxID=529605 RepID=A0AAV1DBW3_OLDCO|nr:OLC1v1004244C1 [Oldenlandia corymbosa var. corymbosa]